MHSGLIKSGLPNPSPGLIPTLIPDSPPSQDPNPKTPQPGPSSFVVRSGVDPSPKTSPNPLDLIAEGRHSVGAICRESKMSILELATQVCTPRNLEALGRVTQLHAIEQEMLLGRLKRDALVRLAELTEEVPAGSADEVRAAEVMRKACADLLRNGGGTTSNTSPRHTQSLPPEPLTPASEAEILDALEKWGQEVEEEEGEKEYPRITQIAQVGWGESKSGNENRYEPRARVSGSVEPSPQEKTPELPPEMIPESPTEMRSSLESISHNGPGARASGSLQSGSVAPPPSKTPPESHLSIDSISPNGPGARASGSYSSPPPESNTDNRILPDDAHPP